MTWPDFSPPRLGPRDLHALEDVLVAHRGADDLPAGRLDRALQPAVRQDRYHEPAGERTRSETIEGEDAEDLVAIDDVPRGIHGDQPVGIAVEGEPDVGAAGHDRLGQ